MNELIQVAERQIGEGSIQTVNARDLHAFLEVGKDFSTWIKDRIAQYGFVESQDYATAQELSSPTSGSAMARTQRIVAYYLSLDMAKEVAMVERNDKGKQARQYFIECERRVKSNVIDITAALADPARLRSVLLVYTEKVIELEAKVKEQAPKAEFHDAVAEAINSQTVQEVAKVLGTGQNRLFRFLREEGLLMANNLPYQQHVNAGYFKVVEKQYKDGRGESKTYTQTLITGRGLTYIQKRISNHRHLLAARA